VSLVWEDAWEVLNDHFRRAAVALSTDHPTLSWSCGHSDNDAFPFRAYASFSGGGPEETDVVVSFDVLRKGDELLFSTDIALEDGQVLADGPTGTVTVTGDLAALRDQIETAVRAAAAFVDENRGLLGKQIRHSTT
jgi:hypothetical protein